MNQSPSMAKSLCRFIPLFIGVSILLAGSPVAQDFKKQVIYQIVTDRFYNGDTTNDNPSAELRTL